MGRRRRGSRALVLATALLGTLLCPPIASHAATVTVINNDGPGEGFNDSTPVAPVGGNTGTTLGEQRRIAFQYAADVWGALLVSTVTIEVNATLDPLSCTSTGAVLGNAGPTKAVRDFAGAPLPSTWYPIALANALNGSDLDPVADITAQFNSALGTTCAFPASWYYGLDGVPGGQIDFVTVVLHELGHGLGFLTFLDLTSGARLMGSNDTYMRNLEDHGAQPPDFPSMTDGQRFAAFTDTGNVHWVGPGVRSASGVLTDGVVGDHVRMFAPQTLRGGSSVSHWDTALRPDELMEPSYTGARPPGLALWLMQDLGWTAALSVVLTASPAAGPGPLSTTLTANVSGAAAGDVTYTFWWNCANAGTSVSAVTAACGDPNAASVGARFSPTASTSQAAAHVYASPGLVVAKVIVERGGAPPAEMRTNVRVGGTLQVTPALNIVSTGGRGGPFLPSAFQYQLSASSDTVDFAISGVPTWLTASIAAGTVTTSPTTITFTVNDAARALAAGPAPATITFANTTNGLGTTTRQATLTVTAVTALAVTPTKGAFSTGGRGAPFSPSVLQYVLTTSSGTSDLASFAISGVPSWLTASATSGTAATGSGTAVTFTLNAAANALLPGIHGATLTFTHTNGLTPSTSRTVTLVVRSVQGDVDGDNRKDLAVYRPGTAEWFVFGSATGLQTHVFGAPDASGFGDRPVPADYDGDGQTDMAIYRPSTGEWFIFGTATGFQTRVFGAPAVSGLGDIPVPADYDGDGKADIAIYRQATGEWFIFGSSIGFRTLVFGAPAVSGLGDTPVPADYDGDGRADLALYRKTTGEWFVFGAASGFQTTVFGAPATSGLDDTPVPADYDGDGKADFAIYRRATAEWFIFGSATGFQSVVFGAPAVSGLGDTPVPGDFDGDGKADIALRRSATAEWFVIQSSTGQTRTAVFGAPSDLPLPRPVP